MTGQPQRLVLVGSVIVDVLMAVPRLPDRGGDVLASEAATQVGGGFNVLAAAPRRGELDRLLESWDALGGTGA